MPRALNVYRVAGLQPAYKSSMAVPIAYRISPNLLNLPAGAVMEEAVTNQSTVFTLTANGASAGTMTLNFRGFTTTVINFSDTAATVAAALNTLAPIAGAVFVGSGTAVNGAGLLLTGSGSPFTNSSIELPTINIVTAFVGAQPVISTSTVGSTLGTLIPSGIASAAARFLTQYLMSTDQAGNVVFSDQAVGEEFGQLRLTAPVWEQGYFRIEDIPTAAITGITGGYLTATTAAALGKVVQGSVTSGAGVIRLT